MNRNIKATVCIVLFVVTLFAGTVFASYDFVKIIVNGQEIKSGIAPQIVYGTTMVPLKVIVESLGADMKWNEQSHAVIITTKDEISKTVATIPKEGVILSAIERKGMYKDFILEVKGCKRFFNWENVSNATYAPELLLIDINHDKQKELIIILTTGTGTGVHVTEAHVINLETLIETYIDNPKAIILKNVKTKIMENVVEITIGNQKTLINKDDFDAKPENFFSNINFENISSFEVANDELKVNVGAQISIMDFVGEVQISYNYKDNMYQADRIEFVRYKQ
jgi:hypothetical protein